MKRLDAAVIGGSLAIIVTYAGIVVLLWRQGVFDVPDSEEGTKVLAAVLALLGGLFATLLTFAGVLLKHSLDQRAEGRLKLETFIQAAQLLATDAGTKAPPTQQAAALFALADLNHLHFALALLREMWPAGDVSPATACWLIDRCLRSNDRKLQNEAAGILAENAETLTTAAECFDWPRVIDGRWPSHLDQNAGINILDALFRCLCSRPVADWHLGCLNPAIVILAEARGMDKNPSVRGNATLLLNVLLAQVPTELGPIMLEGGGALDWTQLSSDIAAEEETLRTSDQGLQRATKLKEWAKGTEPEPSASRPPDPETGTTS